MRFQCPRRRPTRIATVLAVALALVAGGMIYWFSSVPLRPATSEGQSQAGSPGAGGSEVAYRPLSREDLPSDLKAVLDEQRKQPAVVVAKGSDGPQYVLIAIGERPTAGYQVFVDTVRDTGGRVQVEYREVPPGKESTVAQVITYPWTAIAVDSGLPIDVVSAERVPLEPVDEAAQDPSFYEFREALMRAIDRRDVDFLMKSLHPEVFAGFGSSGQGPEVFADYWHPENPDSELWTELKKALELGGTFRGQGETTYFAAPYTFSAFPETLDEFTHAVVHRPAARLRQAPSPDAPVIATLGHEVVKLVSFEPKDGFWQVSARGLLGWVSVDGARLPLDYRAIFTKVNGEWKLRSFVIGD